VFSFTPQGVGEAFLLNRKGIDKADIKNNCDNGSSVVAGVCRSHLGILYLFCSCRQPYKGVEARRQGDGE
jgi:hypothetical protein